MMYDVCILQDDIGASHIEAVSLNKFGYKKIPMREGVIFATYSSLVSQSKASTLTRLQQIINWCGADFDGCLLFGTYYMCRRM